MLTFCYQTFHWPMTNVKSESKKSYTSISKHGGVRVALFQNKYIANIPTYELVCFIFILFHNVCYLVGGGGMFLAFHIRIKYLALFLFIKTNLTSQ